MLIETHESTAKRLLLLAGAVQSWGAKVMVDSEICHPPEDEDVGTPD